MPYDSPAVIPKVGDLLRIPLPIQREALVKHCISLETLRYELAVQTADWLMLLFEKRLQVLHPKDKDVTELDRKIMMQASIAQIERDYLLLTEIASLIKERLELAGLLLTT